MFLDGWKNVASPNVAAPLREKPQSGACFHALPFFTTRFQALFTALSGFFSPFLRSTKCAIDLRGISTWEVEPPIFTHEYHRMLLGQPQMDGGFYMYVAITLFGQAFEHWFHVLAVVRICGPHTTCPLAGIRFGHFGFRSPLLAESMFLLFLWHIRMFPFCQFPCAGAHNRPKAIMIHIRGSGDQR